MDPIRQQCITSAWTRLNAYDDQVQVAGSMCRQECALLLAIVALTAPRLLPKEQTSSKIISLLLNDASHDTREAVLAYIYKHAANLDK
jgi:hypothetical protein